MRRSTVSVNAVLCTDDCQGEKDALRAEIERLRDYAHMASGYLSQHPGFKVCRDCKLSYLEAKMQNPGCGFLVCRSCCEYRFSRAAGFGVNK